MSLITHLTSESQLDSLVAAKKDKLVVIDFHATWCGPCHAIAPTYEKLSKQYSSVATFTKVDVDAVKDLSQKFSIRAMPSFVFLKNGVKVDEVKGANAAAIEAAIKKHTGSSGSAGPAFPGAGHSLTGDTVPPPARAGGGLDKRVMFATLLLIMIWKWFNSGSPGAAVPEGFDENAY